MEISTFTDEYELAAALYGVTPERLREIDGLHKERRPRWIAADDGDALGVVTSHLRGDDRLFGYFGGDLARTAGPLAATVAAALRRDLHVSVDETDTPAFLAAGFRRVRAEDRFRVPFAAVLDRLGEHTVPEGHTLLTADAADPARLLELDTELRQDVPGSECWAPDPVWFREETFDSPCFSADGYLVAVDDETGEYCGLARFWRNTDGPRLGLLAVRATHRGRGLGAALLWQAARAASRWGFDEFTAESDPSTDVMHGWLTRLGGIRTGADVELVRERLTLEPVATRHGHGYVSMIEECDLGGEGYPWNNAPLACTDFPAFAAELADEAAGIGLPDGVAPQRTFVLVKDGIEVLGEFRLRPVISEPYEEHNGHVGYNMRPSVRGRGYATRGLALLLDEARRLGVPGVLVTVEGDNDASARVIEKNGGRVIRSFEGARSFWIDL
ncbi:GNAT family N-acetyltransferase [Phytomonospora sp. NPDC050363]|uniref:GNAT family N-acetyltransferase n=1 Tax=Phytomonospora sp. NPDC050363 TaxID=3155642 RepID=UPI0033EEE227